MIAELRGVTQRVAQQAKFNACVSKVEAHIAKLSEENDKLAALAFGSDVVLESKDGTKVPAIKQTLIESSVVFSGMFSEHTAEGRDGVVRTDASAEALRYVSRCVHTSLGAASANTDTLLEVCELAERWSLTEVLRRAAAAFGDRLDSSTALKTLASADRHMQAGSGSDVWKDILEDAAKAVASGMPDVAEGAEFKTLSIEAVAHVMSHLQEATFELPAFEGGLESNEYGDWGEPVSWLKDSPSANLPSQGIQTRAGGGAATPAMVPPPPVCGQQFGLYSSVSGGVVGFYVSARYSSLPTFARATMELTKPGGPPGGLFTIRPWQKDFGGESRLFRAGAGWGYSRVVTEDTAARYTTDGRFRVSGRVTITKEQRQSEVFNLWLLASGAVEAPLTPLAQLQCLRTCACGFDFSVADAATLTAKLAERDLSTEGQPRTLQTRLRDAMFAQRSLSPALQQASTALATLGACHFKHAAVDGSLFELDAAAMSQVLAHEWLCAGSEKDVLEHVLRWASYAGRTAEVVDSVMPLVRFPLVSMIKPPAKLKELKQRSAVVAELVAEAVKHQVGSTSGSSPAKKHALLPSMPADTEQPRTKRRRFCKKDEIPKVDAATAVLELAF